jgi:hypothetical protein
VESRELLPHRLMHDRGGPARLLLPLITHLSELHQLRGQHSQLTLQLTTRVGLGLACHLSELSYFADELLTLCDR